MNMLSAGINFLSQVEPVETGFPEDATRAVEQSARKLYEAGDYESAIRLIFSEIKRARQAGSDPDLPPPLLEIYFPAPEPYRRMIIDHLPDKIKVLPAETRIKFVLYFLAIIRRESAFNHEAVSPRGAKGLAQIMPATAEEIARTLKLESYDLFKPEDNLKMGMHYFAGLFLKYGPENLAVATAAYNAGPNRIREILKREGSFIENIGSILETSRYIERINEYYEAYDIIYRERIKAEISPDATEVKPAGKNIDPAAPSTEKVESGCFLGWLFNYCTGLVSSSVEDENESDHQP